jgi:hypothetical protein
MNIMMIISKAAFSLLTLTSTIKAWAPKQRYTTASTTIGGGNSIVSVIQQIQIKHQQQQRPYYYHYNNHKKSNHNFLFATQLHSTSSTANSNSITSEVIGTENTESFRLSFKDTTSSSTISPWHDISMKNDDGTYNMVRFFFTYIDINIVLCFITSCFYYHDYISKY